MPFVSHCNPVQVSRIVQSPRSWKQPDTPGVDVHGSVVVVVLVEVLVEVLVLVDVEVVAVVSVVLVTLVVGIVLDVDVVVGSPTPQYAFVHDGCVSLASSNSNVTRHVSDGSAQCENGMIPKSQPLVASQRGAVGSTQRHPANMANP